MKQRAEIELEVGGAVLSCLTNSFRIYHVAFQNTQEGAL